MSRPTIAPTGVERQMLDDDIIVSKTDTKGVLTYANNVFLEIAGYTEDEVIGQPHNMIRHPAMPRCVFQLLWDTLQAGDELFAYVVNLTKEGHHYWVFAHVTPTRGLDGRIIGYHSNRRTMSQAARDVIEPLYAALVEAESREQGAKAQVAAGTAALQAVLDERGQTYDQFVWSLEALTQEVAA